MVAVEESRTLTVQILGLLPLRWATRPEMAHGQPLPVRGIANHA